MTSFRFLLTRFSEEVLRRCGLHDSILKAFIHNAIISGSCRILEKKVERFLELTTTRILALVGIKEVEKRQLHDLRNMPYVDFSWALLRATSSFCRLGDTQNRHLAFYYVHQESSSHKVKFPKTVLYKHYIWL